MEQRIMNTLIHSGGDYPDIEVDREGYDDWIVISQEGREPFSMPPETARMLAFIIIGMTEPKETE